MIMSREIPSRFILCSSDPITTLGFAGSLSGDFFGDYFFTGVLISSFLLLFWSALGFEVGLSDNFFSDFFSTLSLLYFTS
jgi:hypothetical protein